MILSNFRKRQRFSDCDMNIDSFPKKITDENIIVFGDRMSLMKKELELFGSN